MSDNTFSDFLDTARNAVRDNFVAVTEKEINYGHQFTVTENSRKATLNIYNGKKGRKFVFSGDVAVVEKLRNLLRLDENASTTAAESAKKYSGNLWAGSDESGKGDFFGSLVVAAVVVDKDSAAKIVEAGIKDCKMLSDRKILEFEAVIKELAVDYSVLELLPQFYNKRYEEVKTNGGKLNQLLSSGHINALSQVLERNHLCEYALIDQFSVSQETVRILQSRFSRCKIMQHPRAEKNIAVAAASVLARAKFLQTMNLLAEQADTTSLPKGGGSAATEAAGVIAAKYGKEALRNFVKLHFVNYSRI